MSLAADTTIRTLLANALAAIQAREQELGRLDAVAGDGDHGTTMVRGLTAAVAAAAGAAASPGVRLAQAGMAFADAAGGASGALVGMFIATTGQRLGDGPFDTAAVQAALAAGLATVQRLGKAQVGDKTMVDTLAPFVDALAEHVDEPLAAAWQAALPAAEAGAASTAEMVAKLGRASKLGERSVGHRDAGAVSMLVVLTAVGETLAAEG
ncbi:MAG: dihydroxyacetone kinase subunit L [Caldilineaceae bacterium]|nr:dihydroxyacetone kinase subunit L [Caldilineaceae bacterium]